jgi:hypothetical protein
MNRRLLLSACAALTACGDESSMFPIMPGGGGNGGMTILDARIANDSSTTVSAEVCLAADARNPALCSSTGVGGLTVTLGSATATTAVDGTFSIERPTDANAVWVVSGTGIVPSTMAYAEGTKIPAITTTLYSDMVVAMQATISSETAAIIARLGTTSAVTGAVVTATPSPDSLVYYDGPSSTEWELDATGPFGVVWISSIAPGTGALDIDTGGTPASVANIPLVAGAISYVFAEIP